MAYSIKPILHPAPNKEGLHKINIQVIYQRKKVYAPTILKIPANNFEAGQVIKHTSKKRYNDILADQINQIERRLIDIISVTPDISKEDLKAIVVNEGSKGSVEDFIIGLRTSLKGKVSEGRIKHFKTIIAKLHDYAPALLFSQVSVTWLNNFETWLRTTGIGTNTIRSNMTLLKSIMNRARVDGLIKREKFEDYKPPAYIQKLPVFLTEAEMARLQDLVNVVANPIHGRAGYYFLLGCYAGYRISDLSTFNYRLRVIDDNIVLRATKNNRIVSIAIHSRLRAVLDYIKDNPFEMAEQTMRKAVKELCRMAGINKDVIVHTARHSFGRMLAENGFTLDEVADLLGDTPQIARVYFSVSNVLINKKIKERLG